jgi:hypothetical protein
MNDPTLDRIRAGLERRIAAVESQIPQPPAWRAADDLDARPALVRVAAGPAFREKSVRQPRLGLLVAVGAAWMLLLAYGLLGGSGQPMPVPSAVPTSPTASLAASPSPAVSSEPGELRPAIEPRLIIPVRPSSAWTIVDDRAGGLSLVYFLDDVGSVGYNVGLLVVEPRGVYDPVVETTLHPLPADLIGWIGDHPDLESEEPFQLSVAGFPATAIDVTVTYRPDGPKGQTAQFIDVGASLNLEFPSKKRIVLLELPDRPMLIIFDSRPEFFDAGIEAFENELARIQFESGGPSP